MKPAMLCAELPQGQLHRATEMRKRIQDLEAEIVKLKSAEPSSYEVCALRNRLEYKDRMIALKDEVLEVASREHLRFMRLYLERNDEIAILRQTNETLVKKIMKLEWSVFNADGAHGSEGKNCSHPCKDPLPARAPAAERLCRLSTRCLSNAAASRTSSAGKSAFST
jgi:hypothetical protein